jgi:hypothetical protein
MVWGEQTTLEICVANTTRQEGILFGNLFVRIQKGLYKGNSFVLFTHMLFILCRPRWSSG